MRKDKHSNIYRFHNWIKIVYRLEQTYRNLHKGVILSINLKLDSLSYRAGSTLGGSWRFDFLDIQIELLSAWGNCKVLAVTNKKPT